MKRRRRKLFLLHSLLIFCNQGILFNDIILLSLCSTFLLQEAYKCVNGTCIEPPETGKAIITIINGTFERSDEDSESDPYVKVYLDQKFLTKTKIVENKNNPVWMQSFVTPVITSDTQLGFIVFDKDPTGEELLLTEQTTVNLILALGLNATATCGPPGSPRGQLCYSIQWHSLTPQPV